jgi:4a-hydroxytetrahydrobiopterin dehydratase
MKLSEHEIESYLKKLIGWSCDDKTHEIYKSYNFKGFLSTMNFVNAVAFLAQKYNHHPEMIISFSKCTIKLTTHDVQGLSHKDFELAQKIDDLN